MALAEATRAEIVRARDRYPQPRSAILPSLWAVQHEFGYLPPEGLAEVAELLGLAASQVQAVSTFYSMYFQQPSGRHHLLVCTNVACALRGSDDIVSHLEQRLGCASGGTTADGAFTWQSTVECLGACGGAPAMQVDHDFHENLTPAGIDALLERLRAAAPAAEVPAGPAAGRPGAVASHAAATATTAPAARPARRSGSNRAPAGAPAPAGDSAPAGDPAPAGEGGARGTAAKAGRRRPPRPRPAADDL